MSEVLTSILLVVVLMVIYLIGYYQGAAKQKREARAQLGALIAMTDTIARVNHDSIPSPGLRENLCRVLKELG